MHKVRFGMIGVKGIGKTHINGILSTEEAELLAISDINEEEGRSAASTYGVKWYNDYEKMLELEELDAVTICTPHYLHYPMVMKTLDSVKHVLVEKPMAITMGEADKMIANARRRGLKLGVVFQYRTDPVNRQIKRLIETGELGRIYRVCMEACCFRTQSYYNRDAWRGRWATEGGGALINQTIHDLDLLGWFVGKPSRLQGQISTLYHDIEVEDIASAIILFDNGAHGVVQVGVVDAVETTRLEICGEKGKIVKEEGKTQHATLGRPLKEYVAEERVWDVGIHYDWRELKPETETIVGHTAVIKDFAQAILGDKEPMVNGENGRISLELMNAIILSSFEGKAVSFPLNRDAYDKLMKKLMRSSKPTLA